MTTVTSFDEIIHRNDEKGVYCNSTKGRLTTLDADVTCRKCKKLIADPKRLASRRSPKVERVKGPLPPVAAEPRTEDEGDA